MIVSAGEVRSCRARNSHGSQLLTLQVELCCSRGFDENDFQFLRIQLAGYPADHLMVREKTENDYNCNLQSFILWLQKRNQEAHKSYPDLQMFELLKEVQLV